MSIILRRQNDNTVSFNWVWCRGSDIRGSLRFIESQSYTQSTTDEPTVFGVLFLPASL